jgi:LmbE family N-acetylglucosaminyl deacetylase
MKRALFLSPHLDDVVFSCGATLLRLLESGWQAEVITIFTGNVASPRGFALECQTSKGIAPDVDYMALRRAEDRAALEILGASNISNWEFLEAPHRGYDSPPELFAGMRLGDEIWRQIAEKLAPLSDFDLVFAPQGLGNHVDHLQLIRAVLELGWAPKTAWYRDTPYAIREPEARPSPLLPTELQPFAAPFDAPVLERKIAACCAYASQIGFQFGGEAEVARKLTAFHASEAEPANSPFAERFLRAPGSEFLL